MMYVVTLRAAPAYFDLPTASEADYQARVFRRNHLASAWQAADDYLNKHRWPERVGDTLLLPPPMGAKSAPITDKFNGKMLGVADLHMLEPGDVLAVGFWGCCIVVRKFHPATSSVFKHLEWLVGVRSAAVLLNKFEPHKIMQHNKAFIDENVCLLTGPNNWREPRRSVPALTGIKL